MPWLWIPPRGTPERERERERERLYFHCAVEMKQPHTMAVPSPKKQGNIRGSHPGAFSRRCTQTGNAPGGWRPLMHFPALGSHAFGRLCYSLWLFHLHSAVKIQPFYPVFPLAGSTAKAFFRLSLWNFKEKSINHFYNTAFWKGPVMVRDWRNHATG